MLTESVEYAVADMPSRLGGYVAECDSGAACGDHQRGAASLAANFCRNLGKVVGNDYILLDRETGLLQTENDGGAGTIDPKPLKTRVADGNHDSLHSCDFTLQGSIWSGRITPSWGAKRT
jgi:hypothetical protein